MRRLLLTVVVLLPLVSNDGPPGRAAEPEGHGLAPLRSPEDSLRSIRVAEGLVVELVAAEPLVEDPIAFEWGADGRLWVVEMGDYPLGVDGEGKPGGVVRVLGDADGDGRYDEGTVFLDGLGFPTGVMPWREGVLVACAPDIFYAEDRDGDGKADHREVLFTGFVEGNQQHRVNGFELGLDGWIYGANGDSGGAILAKKTGEMTAIGGRDFRFRPDTGAFEAESGQTQFGRHRDDWGHWFGNNNPNWGWHYVLSEADLRRNPHYAPPDPRRTLEPSTRLYPISRTLDRFNDPVAANHVTSANSPTPYRDDLFGPGFAGSLFVSEPVHNLVHRMVIEPDGATFRGVRAAGESDREFLASTDHAFRPTMLKTGPDGALWIADMYRAVIEHPEWIPDDWEARIDLRSGSEQGRIYRVFPVDRRPRPIPRLDRLDAAGLVAALESPNGWRRDTAQRLLMHRGGTSAVGPLRALATHTDRPKTRVQALWTLAVLGGLDEATALAALLDAHPEVRRNAARAAGPLMGTSPRVAAALLRLADDADTRVRLQVASLLGDRDDPAAGRALAKLARRDGGDPWMRAAVLSSALPHLTTLVAELFRKGEAEPSPGLVEPLVAMAGALDDRGAIESLVRAIATPARPGGRYAPWQYSGLSGLLSSLDRRGGGGITKDLGAQIAPLRDAARALVRGGNAPEADMLPAIALLGRGAANRPADLDLIAGLLGPRVPVGLQQAAVTALGRTADARVPGLLLRGWKGHSPRVRGAILDALLAREPWTVALFSALDDGRMAPGDVDPARRQRLLAHRNGELKARAEALFAGQETSRRRVIDAYRPALALKGNAEAGAPLFKTLCASCHRLGDEGVEVGPDLAALNDRSPEALLVAILDPNRAFESRYAGFTIATDDGRVLTGLIAGESASAVTLRRQEGGDVVLLRSQIEEMAGSGQSLMPEGVEKDLTPQQLADLIAFLARR